MKRHIYLIPLAAILFVCLGCRGAASQTQAVSTQKKPEAAAPQTKAGTTALPQGDELNKLISVRHNAKYNLSLSFRQYLVEHSAPINYVRLRSDKINREVDLRDAYLEEVFPENARDLWSPDEEYLLLSCGTSDNGFCLYRASAMTEFFGADGFFKSDGYFDRIEISPDKDKAETSYRFAGWEGSTAFRFNVGREKYQAAEQVYKFEHEGKYKYDFAEQKLYCLDGSCRDGENKTGRIRAGKEIFKGKAKTSAAVSRRTSRGASALLKA